MHPNSFPEEFLQVEDLTDLGNDDAFNLVGQLIDFSDIYNRPEGTDLALKLCEELAARSLSDHETALLHYFRANAWDTRRRSTYANELAWEWDQPELLKQLFHLRSAIRHQGFSQLDQFRRCQIFTNTANLLNTIGRMPEAIEYWDRALALIPNFGMALGNRGYGLKHYAFCMYDRGHAVTLMKFAHDNLRKAGADDAFFEAPGHEQVQEAMANEADDIAAHVDLGKLVKTLDLENHTLGRSEKERAYRRWCLGQRLFLNPLNDLGPYPIAARDILALPGLVVSIGEPPTLIGFYNQLKQEYVAARYFYYEGVNHDSPHFADRDVLLLNTLDYPVYAVAVERIKVSWRMAYSLFDKIAFFINDYWKLEMPERSISFHSVWQGPKQKKGHPGPRKKIFGGYQNLPLRGLYWLSKDLLENEAELADTMEPDAQSIKTIRDHLEHKYLKVHDWMWAPERYAEPVFAPFRDSLAYSIRRDELESKALRLLKLARAGLIYLSLAVHREERLRSASRDEGLVMPMQLDTWQDQWKR